MKADELMIGDWVQGFVPDSYSTIYGIFNEGRIAIIAEPSKTYIELSPEDVQPIPLTPEILEKNGFALDRLGNYFPEDKRYDLEISEIEGDIYWTICWGDHSILRLRFVHELQHCLRLVGIEKKIVL